MRSRILGTLGILGAGVASVAGLACSSTTSSGATSQSVPLTYTAR